MDDVKMEDIEKALVSLREAFEDYDQGVLTKTRQITPDFNAFSILYALELPLSRMLRELLRPDGSHGQGRLFLDLFLESFLRDMNLAKKGKNVSVEREFTIPNGGRIDIFIDIDEKYGITIENKPYASDQEKQIHRYHEFMSRKYDENNLFILYLSRDGSLPSEYSLPREEREELGDRFQAVKYREIREWCNSCALEASKAGASRLCAMIEELSEFISREFCGMNTLKNKMLGGAIEKNILEAFEMSQLWQKNKAEFEAHWQETVNRLFNEELPGLVFERLKKDGVIDDDWEWIKGKLKIDILHIEGFRLKKRQWKHFEIGLLSDKFKYPKGIRGFFPAIISSKKIENKGYLGKYFKQTGTDPIKNPGSSDILVGNRVKV